MYESGGTFGNFQVCTFIIQCPSTDDTMFVYGTSRGSGRISHCGVISLLAVQVGGACAERLRYCPMLFSNINDLSYCGPGATFCDDIPCRDCVGVWR